MKSIRMLGLAALLALMAMAVLGASSASAEPTALCSADESPCEAENEVTHVHETTLSGAKATLLNGISNVLCDVLFLGEVVTETVSAGGLPISGNFTYTNCVDEKPNGCTVAEENGPSIIDVLKEGEEEASVVGEGLVKVVCSGITCRYTGSGLLGTGKGPLKATEENGEVSIQKQTVAKEGSALLCPSSSTLDIVVTPLEPVYITAPEPAKIYCVKLEHEHGFYLGENCGTGPGETATHSHEIAVGPKGRTGMQCIAFLNRTKNGLYKGFESTEKCTEDNEANTGSYELGEIL